MGRQPRQRPISCHLCRVRKLRCSRQFPCSNCTSRGVVCQHEGVTMSSTAAAAGANQSPQVKTSVKDSSSLDLLARLERLESLVASQGKDGETTPAAKRQVYPERLPTTSPQTSIGSSRPVPPNLQRLTHDALQLERSCTNQKLTDSLISEPIIFRTCPARLATSQPSYAFQNGTQAAMAGPAEVIKCIWLPRRDEMRTILQKYITDISYFHHIVHIPSLHSLAEDIYKGLDANLRVDIGGVVLMISIIASATYAWGPIDDVRCLYSNANEANAQSTFWIKQALDVIDQAQRTSHASLECIQGLIILFFVFCNHESVSQRARNALLSAVSMATELQLHRLDDPQGIQTLDSIRMSEARKEIGRRVWWYLVTTDWMLAQFSSPQEGFYLIHKNQMAVNKPRNCHDEDIVEGVEIIDRPRTEPTCISFFLQRIRLAEVCQELLDKNPLASPVPEPAAYQNILDTDAILNEFLRDLPEFLLLDTAKPNSQPPTDIKTSPFITIQRYTLNLLLHRQLCKIHLPYLAQGTVDPAYAYSRDACLRSARVVIELDHQLQQLQQDYMPFFTSRLRLTMVLRSVFLASTALVLNACLKGETEGSSEEGGEEVAGAWKILHEAQGQSPTATKLLELSVQILRKYKIKHRALDLLQQQVSEMPTQHGFPMTPDSAHHDQRMNMMSQSVGDEPDTTLLEQQWQMLEGRMDLSTIDWDKLFWGLDAPFI